MKGSSDSIHVHMRANEPGIATSFVLLLSIGLGLRTFCRNERRWKINS